MVTDISGIPGFRAALLIIRTAMRDDATLSGWAVLRSDFLIRGCLFAISSRSAGEYGPMIANDRWGLRAPDFATLSLSADAEAFFCGDLGGPRSVCAK